MGRSRSPPIAVLLACQLPLKGPDYFPFGENMPFHRFQYGISFRAGFEAQGLDVKGKNLKVVVVGGVANWWLGTSVADRAHAVGTLFRSFRFLQNRCARYAFAQLCGGSRDVIREPVRKRLRLLRIGVVSN